MGILSLFFALLLSGGMLVIFQQKLSRRRQAYQESFAVLKTALGYRHQAVRKVLERAQLYLIDNSALAERLSALCADAERKLSHTANYFSAESLAMLANAENELNAVLRQLQAFLAARMRGVTDKPLKSVLELLDSVESDVVYARRRYNASADYYNQLLHQVFLARVAALLGHGEKAATLKFEDNNVTQMSRDLMV